MTTSKSHSGLHLFQLGAMFAANSFNAVSMSKSLQKRNKELIFFGTKMEEDIYLSVCSTRPTVAILIGIPV